MKIEDVRQFLQRLVLLDRVAPAIESRRLVCHPFACSASLCIRPAHAEARRRGERAQVLQGLSDGAAPVAGNERFTCHLEAAPWGARHAVPPHPSLEVGASRNAADPDEG